MLTDIKDNQLFVFRSSDVDENEFGAENALFIDPASNLPFYGPRVRKNKPEDVRIEEKPGFFNRQSFKNPDF